MEIESYITIALVICIDVVTAGQGYISYPMGSRQGFGYAEVQHGIDQSASPDLKLLRVAVTRSKLECVASCYSDDTCHTVQYSKVSRECMLFKRSSMSSPVTVASGHVLQHIVIDIGSGLALDCFSRMQPADYSCPLYSKRCRTMSGSEVTRSGIYPVTIGGTTSDVYCDLEKDGGGWTVVQRRVDATVDFYRPWADYVAGFGDLDGNLWLGLDAIHLLSKDGVELHVYLETFEGESAYAHYSLFSVASQLDNYRLTVTGYSGTAGDAFARHNGQFFSTYDRDNDPDSGRNCASLYKGAWWYEVCHDSNLNGQYLGGSHVSFADGVNWRKHKGDHYSYKTVVMKVRPTE